MPLQEGEISLSISYVTFSASWQPRYDLSLNTVKCTGTLEYGAELRNTTSEVWEATKVILSTSQTTFSGLNESIPFMHSWHVKLVKGKESDGALFSQRELRAKRNEYSSKQGWGATNRHEVFGYEAPAAKPRAKTVRNNEVTNVLNNYSAPMPHSMFGNHSSTAPVGNTFGSAGGGGGLFGSSAAAGGLFGNNPGGNLQSSAPARHGAERSRRVLSHEEYDVEEEREEDDDDMGFGLFDDDGPKPLVFEEGAWEESGMTTVSYNCAFFLLSVLALVKSWIKTTFILPFHPLLMKLLTPRI